MKNRVKDLLISFMFIVILNTSNYAFAATDELDSFSTPNAPILYNDMTPIKWSGSYEQETKSDDLDWYNYTDKKWANAKDENGDYWVWIPRYTYKIVGEEISILWSSGTTDYIADGYTLHPAFVADAYTGGDPNESANYKNGNGKDELTGFWVAKYMASNNDNKISIKPNRYPDVNKNVGEAFETCINMSNNLGVSTHLIKASEWGAISYLTKTFGVIPSENNTGFTGGNNSNSTTNNIYGVFDMNGMSGEYLSSFVMKDSLDPSLLEIAGSMIYDEYEKCVDVVELSNDDNASNNKSRLQDFYGFAMSETSFLVKGEYENVPTGSEPFFSKGGSNVGMFGYDRSNGIGLGYRPTLSIYSSYLSEDIAFFDTEASVVAGDYLVVSVNFSVDKGWKFGLTEGEEIIKDGKVISGKEERIFDFIDLRYAQNNKSMTLTNANLNAKLISVIEGDKTVTELNDKTEFKADTQYTVRVRVGGCNNEGVPVFLAIPGMTSKIIVNNIDVVSVDDGTNLKVSSIFNNKVRLSIYDSQGRIPVLTGVKLITVPDKKDYYKGERLSLVGGTLEVSYGDNKAIVELTKDNVKNYETVTDMEGENQLVELIYGGVEVTQDTDNEYRINVRGNRKFYVRGGANPKNSAVIVSGLGQYSAGEEVSLKASVYPGYKFSSWSSQDVTITANKSVDEAYFNMPDKEVNVVVNTIGASRLEVRDPKIEFERGDAFELGDGKIIAYYPDGSSEELTLNSPGVTSNPGKNEILDEWGKKTVEIEYGGQKATYEINVIKEKYNLTFYIDSVDEGSIKMGENIILPVNDETTTTLRVSYDYTVIIEAEPNEGYTFYGWYASDGKVIPDENLTDEKISFLMPQNNLILKASFVEAHTVTYEVEDEKMGSISGNTKQVIKHGENGTEVTAVAKDGYMFKEWIQDGRTEAKRFEQYVISDATYTARFVETHTVTYYVDNVIFATRRVEHGASGYISEVPEKVGSVFSSWVVREGNDSTLDCVISNMEVDAKLLPWIEFEPNGSTEAKDFVDTVITGRTVKDGTFEYIVSESNVETGENISDYVTNDTFIFNGSWKKDGALYKSYIEEAKEDSSTTITIKSNNDKEIVKFDYTFAVGTKAAQLLGITVNGTRVTEYDEETNVWHNFNREVDTINGEIVIGISYSQDNKYADSDYAAIQNLKIGRQWTKISSIYHLMDSAIWSENYVHVRGVFPYQGGEVTYQVVSEMFKGNNNNQGDLFTITYELNDGIVDGENPTSYTKSSGDITLINPTKVGAEFLGWTGSNGNTPQKEVTIPSGSSGNKSYEANWLQAGWNIEVIQSDNGTITPDSMLVNYGENATFTIKPNKGYELSDVRIDGTTSVKDQVVSGEDDSTTYTFNNVTRNHTITATFTPIKYTITYKLNGGTATNSESYTIEESITLSEPTKDRYTFAGWTGSNGTVPQKEVIIPSGSFGNKSYEANWKINNVAPTTPTVTIQNKTTSSFTVSAVSTDTDGDNLTYTLYVGGTSKGSKTAVAGTQVTFDTVTGLSEYTTYSYYVEVTDGIETVTSSTGSIRTYCDGKCDEWTIKYRDIECEDCEGTGECSGGYSRSYTPSFTSTHSCEHNTEYTSTGYNAYCSHGTNIGYYCKIRWSASTCYTCLEADNITSGYVIENQCTLGCKTCGGDGVSGQEEYYYCSKHGNLGSSYNHYGCIHGYKVLHD